MALLPASPELPPLPALPTMPSGSQLQESLVDLTAVSNDLSEFFDAFLLQLQITSNFALVGAAVLALCVGLIFGDRSSPTQVFNELQDANTFREELSEAASAAWDRGETDLTAIGTSRGSRFARAQEADEQGARSSIFGEASRNLARPVSAGLWLELLLCVLLDAAGNASLFVPDSYGELSDIVSASAIAFFINLLFDWPALAAFAFWEELLPYTDIVPTCTVGWTMILLGVRPWLRARQGLPPRDARPKPPVSDLRSYSSPDPWLRPGTRPWDEE